MREGFAKGVLVFRIHSEFSGQFLIGISRTFD